MIKTVGKFISGNSAELPRVDIQWFVSRVIYFESDRRSDMHQKLVNVNAVKQFHLLLVSCEHFPLIRAVFSSVP